MNDLKCALKDCRFNQGFCCVARSIDVDGSAKCKTYEVSETKAHDRLFEIGSESSKPNYYVDTHISCNASKCLYNKSCSCNANGVTVLGCADTDRNQADCATYMPK